MTGGFLRAFFPSFPLAALSAWLLVPVARRLAPRIGLIDHPRADRFHSRPIPLLGGPTCIVATLVGSVAGWIALGMTGGSARGFLPGGLAGSAIFGAAALAILGLVDDRRAMPPLRKGVMVGAALAGSILLWRPGGALGGATGWAIAWVGGMVVVNAWNYLDHADGIFATAAAGASAILALAWWRAGSPVATATLAAICGCLLGYLIWNAPPARIFMGDSGSLSLGFLMFIAGAAILDEASSSLRPVALASNAIPLVDFSLVTIARIGRGQNPFRGGREHTGHRLTDRYGPRWAVILVACVSLFFGLAWILPGPTRPGLALFLVGAGGVLLLVKLGRIPPPD